MKRRRSAILEITYRLTGVGLCLDRRQLIAQSILARLPGAELLRDELHERVVSRLQLIDYRRRLILRGTLRPFRRCVTARNVCFGIVDLLIVGVDVILGERLVESLVDPLPT